MTEADFAQVDLDSLDFKSDYARFMRPDTPQSIRQRALRKLWKSSSVFTEPDGLLDYAKDFGGDCASHNQAVATAYQVGRGFMTEAEISAWEQLGDAKPHDEARSRRDPGTPAADRSTIPSTPPRHTSFPRA